MRSVFKSGLVLAAAAPAAILAGGFLYLSASATSPSFLHYDLTLKDGDLNILQVQGHVFGAAGRNTSITAPAGGFEKIQPLNFTARDSEGGLLEVDNENGGWTVHNGRKDFTYAYEVVLTIEDRYSPDIKGMLSMLNVDRCRIFGRDIFIAPDDGCPGRVIVDVGIFPEYDIRSEWPTVGGRMIVADANRLPLTVFVSGNYRYIESDVMGTEIGLAIAGDWSFEDDELLFVIKRIVSKEIALFGSSPHRKHLFICDANPVRGGRGFDYYGVHFAGCIVLLLDPAIDGSDLFDTQMSIIAHEFFHNWNGEAIRPDSDDFLWFVEGATVYYSYMVLLSLDIITESQYESKRETIASRYMNNPYLNEVPVGSAANVDLSDKDMVNLLYDGGFLVSESLDRKVRELTDGRNGLIDVLKYMYDNADEWNGVDDDVLIESINRVCGHDLSRFLQVLVREPAPELPLENHVSS